MFGHGQPGDLSGVTDATVHRSRGFGPLGRVLGNVRRHPLITHAVQVGGEVDRPHVELIPPAQQDRRGFVRRLIAGWVLFATIAISRALARQ
ncbi:hypothetical protein GCM10009525_18530 [Streptosporangium amethystogenes subsp. fukuiense]